MTLFNLNVVTWSIVYIVILNACQFTNNTFYIDIMSKTFGGPMDPLIDLLFDSVNSFYINVYGSNGPTCEFLGIFSQTTITKKNDDLNN